MTFNQRHASLATPTPNTVSADLTVCTVILDTHRHFVDRNIGLTLDMNAGAKVRWIIADNQNTQAPSPLETDYECVELVGGVPFDSTEVHEPRGSFHHGLALNRIIERIETRFLLVLDPDFFIVRSDWLQEVVDHMLRNDLALFGVPWHPKWYQKLRYFPCAHCLFIDTTKVRKRDIDFRPKQRSRYSGELQALKNSFREGQADTRTQGIWFATLITLSGWVHRATRGMRGGRIENQLERLWRFIYQLTLEHKLIEHSADTGIRLFKKFGQDSQIKLELLQPYLRVPQDYPEIRHLHWLVGRAFEKLFPERLRYIPKRRDSYSTKGFADFGYPDVTPWNWEQFLWQDRPFGFHIRYHGQGQINKDRCRAEEIRNLEAALDGILQRMKKGKTE